MLLAANRQPVIMEYITLAKDHLQWQELFTTEANLLRHELGDDIVALHHVGSTAVPDLLAKPVIDIALESIVFPPSDAVIRKLELSGYEYKGEAGVPGRYFFTKGQPRKFNLHYCAKDSNTVRKQIAFRDKLIESLHLKNKYEKIKLENYKDRDIDSSEYAGAKSGFVEYVLGLK